MELYILNRGTEPTFLDSRRQEVIDITIRSGGILDLLRGWRVSDEPSESDHRQVRFTMEQVQSQGLWMRNPRKTNWRGYEEDLKSRLKEAPTRFYTKEKLETAADYLNDAIKYLYEMNCPLESKNPSAKAPWWSKELAKLRAEGRRLFNRARNVNTPRSWEEYRKSQRIYKKAIVKAKRKGWRSFCSSIESAPEASRLSRILCKENQTQWGCLKLPNGEYTETAEEILRHLMEIYFPGFREDLADNNNRQRPMTVHKSRAWGLAAKVVYPQAVEWAVGSFEPLKAPGPDGIYPILLQKGLSSLLGPMTKIYRAKRLVDRFLKSNSLIQQPLVDSQYAYREGRSTETALHHLIGKVESQLKAKGYAIGISGHRGRFDSTSHEVVGEALIRHGVQEPLVDWIEDMLVDRCLTVECQDISIRGKPTRGCPQGGSLISSVVVPSDRRPAKGATEERFLDLWLC
ncbi:uncharacterized protein LOC114941203 [Nylanderia fulva]|uniref:uncharacterized protein LOC114941203 n=1 Tax=Nylanderia fulva TaxID=613905 RepID=UPI0010FB9584|nr:uncharacterized protein LOC114941203 [Nylanderia fulva]